MGFQLIVVVVVNARVQVNAYVIRFIKGSYARIVRYVSLLCVYVFLLASQGQALFHRDSSAMRKCFVFRYVFSLTLVANTASFIIRFSLIFR